MKTEESIEQLREQREGMTNTMLDMLACISAERENVKKLAEACRRFMACASTSPQHNNNSNTKGTEQMSTTDDASIVSSGRKLFAIDEVANLVQAVEAVYDDDGNIVADREPEYWAEKVTGAEIVPDVTLPCVHAWDGDAENVRRGIASCWVLGVPAREVLALWGRSDWKSVECVVVK